MRSCGECTVCCTLFRVPELEKPAGIPCSNLCATGCGIHATRPFICANFTCGWLAGDIPEEMRPDKIHVVIEKLQGVPVVLALPMNGYEKTWRTEPVVNALKRDYQQKGIAVVASDRMVLVPEGRTVEEVMGEVFSTAHRMGIIA